MLIETLPAAFEMDEILRAARTFRGPQLRRWDYIFSSIKHCARIRLRAAGSWPGLMETPFLSVYVRLLIRTCHRCGIHAMGGMAAQIPIKDDPLRTRRR